MRRSRFWLRILPGFVLPIVLLYLLVTWSFKENRLAGLLPLKSDDACSAALGMTQEENVQKIQSYSFPGIGEYLSGLSITKATGKTQEMPEFPTIVTALSSSHFHEGLQLVDNVNTVVREKYPKVDLVVFDIGLTVSQRKQIESKCNCIVKVFPFGQFPDHVRIMKGYTWKPLAIQLVAAEHPFVFWADTSVRFTTSDLDHVFGKVKDAGVMAAVGFESLAVRTARSTFEHLHEIPCTFRDKTEFEGTFLAVYANTFVKENFLRPWVSCALTLGCMVPIPNQSRYLNCAYTGKPVYHLCHRYDQSVLSILLHRLYSDTEEEHRMMHTFFQICKGGDELWLAPDFLNEMVVSMQQTCF